MKLATLMTIMAALALVLWSCSKDSPSGPTTPGPAASFDVTGGTVTPAALVFTNTSQNADHYQWDFGDGRTSTQTSPSMTYDVHGQFTVTLVATQSSSGRSATASHSVTITPGIFFMDTVTVELIPFADSQGAGWDLASGPDLMFELVRGSTVISTSSVIEDIAPSQLPVHWYYQSGYRITDWSTTHAIDLYDYDAGSANDYIGSVTFSVNGSAGQNAYPDRVTLQNSTHTIRVLLAVRWE